MSIRKEYYKKVFIMDHLDLSYRIALLGVSLVSILIIWLFCLYYPQDHAAKAIKQKLLQIQQSTTQINFKKNQILTLAKLPAIQADLKLYQELQNAINTYDTAIKNYQNRYLNENALINMLYTMLNKANRIQVVNFSTLAPEVKKPQSPLEVGIPNNTPKTVPTQPTDALLNQPREVHYNLSIKGHYFDILNFLNSIEHLKWQIFWDKFNYKVLSYPNGLANIDFFTLRANSEISGLPINNPAPTSNQRITP